MDKAFDVKGVTKIYHTGDVEVHALRGVDMTLYAGELSVLLGPSGSGKSTLLNILGGLDGATAGQVEFNGDNLTGLSEGALTRYRRKHVGFVFQFYNLMPSLTARENVAIVTEIADDPMRPEDALDLVGLSDRLDHFQPSFRAGNSSGWRSPARSSSARVSCCATNPPALWTARPAFGCSRP